MKVEYYEMMICTTEKKNSTTDTVRDDDYGVGGAERIRYAGIKYNK